MVELESISVRYGDFQALHDVSLRIPPGAVGLVGRNGAGKSTLLKVLLGLVRPDQGGGRILGEDLLGAGRLLRRRVGYMPENDAFLLGMWGIEQVSLAGELCGLTKAQAIRRAHEVLGYVDLGEARYRPVEQYSTGMRQRLKLAVALVHDPRLLLLDEPTVGLDPPGRKRMLDLIDDLVREHEKSIVISTHLLGDVEHTCEHVVMMEQGRVIAAGGLREVMGAENVHYRLRWAGQGTRFIEALHAEGGLVVERVLARVGGREGSGELRIAMPAGFEPRRFFTIAKEHQVVLLTMRTDHGDLTDRYHHLLEEERARDA